MTELPSSPPPVIAKRGIAQVADSLPPGAELDVVSDFIRIFRPEIEARLLRWPSPLASVESRRVSCPPPASLPSA